MWQTTSIAIPSLCGPRCGSQSKLTLAERQVIATKEKKSLFSFFLLPFGPIIVLVAP